MHTIKVCISLVKWGKLKHRTPDHMLKSTLQKSRPLKKGRNACAWWVVGGLEDGILFYSKHFCLFSAPVISRFPYFTGPFGLLTRESWAVVSDLKFQLIMLEDFGEEQCSNWGLSLVKNETAILSVWFGHFVPNDFYMRPFYLILIDLLLITVCWLTSAWPRKAFCELCILYTFHELALAPVGNHMNF